MTNPVVEYYHRTESRVGYRLFLGGTKHFGLYEPGESMWSFGRSMRRMEDRLAASLGLAAGARVLDAGSGMGDVASRMALAHGLDVTGIDLLDFNVAEANRRAARRGIAATARFEVGDYSDIRADDASLDGVYTMETLVHAPNAERVLAEFHRVLKPGGRLALIEYSRKPDAAISPASSAAFARVNKLSAMPSFQRFEFGVLERLMSDAGFESIVVEDLTERMLPMLHAFARLASWPYAIGLRFGLGHKLANAMSAVEFWRHRADFRYSVYMARKPG